MIETAIIVGALLAIAAALNVGYVVGRVAGRQEVINRLLDCKDPEMWNAAHFVRADMKDERLPTTRIIRREVT